MWVLFILLGKQFTASLWVIRLGHPFILYSDRYSGYKIK